MSRRSSVLIRRCAQAFKVMVDRHCAATGDSQEDIAADLPISYPTFNNYLQGHASIPTDVLIIATRALGPDAFIEFGRMANLLVLPMPEPAQLDRDDLRELFKRFQMFADKFMAATAPDSAAGAHFSKTEADEFDRLATHLQGVVEAMKERARADAANHEWKHGSLAEAERRRV